MSVLEEVLLYVALAAGYLLSRVRPPPHQLDLLSRGTVLLLVGSLGVLLAGEGPIDPVSVLLPSAGMALLLVLLSATFARALGAAPGSRSLASGSTSPISTVPGRERIRPLLLPALILVALLVGYVLGRQVATPQGWGADLIEVFLVLLLFEVGWQVRLTREALRHLPVPLVSAAASALVVALVATWAVGYPLRVSLAIVSAFGWYSLAGPYVTQAVGPALGLVAFLTNFLRENFTMVGAPALGRMAGGEGISGAGGATSMDTTLYFASRYGGQDAAALALATGTILTLLAPLLLGGLLGGG